MNVHTCMHIQVKVHANKSFWHACVTYSNESLRVQGGEDPWNASSCVSSFAKEPLIIRLFCGKWPLEIRHPSYDSTPPCNRCHAYACHAYACDAYVWHHVFYHMSCMYVKCIACSRMHDVMHRMHFWILLIYMCDMTYPYVWHEISIHMTWQVYMHLNIATPQCNRMHHVMSVKSSHPTHRSLMSHIWNCQVIWIIKSCHTYGYVISHM